MLILQLAIIIIASKLAGDLSKRLGQPPVLGKILIGVILGSSVLGLIAETDKLAEFAQIGVILLMFIAGLETDINDFKKSLKSSLLVGFGGIIVPLGTGYLVGTIMHMNHLEALFLGLLLSATSVSISVQALKDMKQLKNKKGSAILGAAVIDDIVIIVALAFLMTFVGKDINLTKMIVEKIVFFIIAILAAWKIVPWFLKKFSSLKVSETIISSALVLCFLFAYYAEFSGISAIIGAYIAGIAISVTDYKEKVFEKVQTIGYSLFVPIFFTYIGVTAHLSGIVDNIGFVVIFCLIAISTKFIGAALGARVSGFGWKSSMGIGSAMVSRGEVALIVAKIGLDAKLLSHDLFTTLIIVVLVTTLVTPIMMKFFFQKDMKTPSSLS